MAEEIGVSVETLRLWGADRVQKLLVIWRADTDYWNAVDARKAAGVANADSPPPPQR